jgi:hypothetical protein
MAVVNLETDYDAAAPTPSTFGVHMECLDIVPGISQMSPGTSQAGSCDMRLGSEKPQLNVCIPGFLPPTQPVSSLIQNAKPVELTRFYRCIYPPQLITMSRSDYDEDMLMAAASMAESCGKFTFLRFYLGE